MNAAENDAARRGRRRGPFLAANLVLAALAVPVADQLIDTAGMRIPTDALLSAASAPPAFSYEGISIDNVYPYDRTGRLLHDVRLYDGRGRPLDIARDATDPSRRTVHDARGATVFNAFPVRHFAPGTHRVAHPQAGPPIAPRRLTTPPVRSVAARRG